jgi:hypothetical protein
METETIIFPLRIEKELKRKIQNKYLDTQDYIMKLIKKDMQEIDLKDYTLKEKNDYAKNLKIAISEFLNGNIEYFFKHQNREITSTYAKIIFCKIIYEKKIHNIYYSLCEIGNLINRNHATVLHYKKNYFNNKYALEFNEVFSNFIKNFNPE